MLVAYFKDEYMNRKEINIIYDCYTSGAPNGNFRENICSEDDLRSKTFGAFVVKFLAFLPLLGFSNNDKMV